MSELTLNADDLTSLVQRFVSPESRFEDGRIVLRKDSVTAVLRNVSVTADAEVRANGLTAVSKGLQLNDNGLTVVFSLRRNGG